MAPPLPRPSICTLQAALSACRISPATTTASTTTLHKARPLATKSTPSPTTLLHRSFTTTTSARNTTTSSTTNTRTVPLPPESPRFITVPEPPQHTEEKLPPIKGHLPVPRNIFPKRDGDRKIQPEYIAAATQLSKSEQAGQPPRSEEDAKRRVLAHARRAALTQGLRGLYSRKVTREARRKARAEKRRQENLARANAPERLDEVLTRGSVRLSTSASTHVPLDPQRFERAEAARAEYERHQAAKAEARRDALARLYVAAGNFIVDEQELEKRINELFVEDAFVVDTHSAGRSIWDKHAPVSVAEVLGEQTGITSSKVTDSHRSLATKTTARQKTVAEELTGSKL